MQRLFFSSYSNIESSINLSEKVPANIFIKKNNAKQLTETRTSLQDTPEIWATNQQLLYNELWTESQILVIKARLHNIVSEILHENKLWKNQQF